AKKAYVEFVYPCRWCWLHWWEANREPYLDRVRQGRGGQKPDQKVTDEYRARAVAALLAETKSEHWQGRAAAALALGRMNETKALDALKALASDDKSETVRLFALAALGLLDTPEAEKFLRGQKFPTPEQREAALVGAGLLANVSPETITGLQKVLGDRFVGPATVAAWALRHRSDPRNLLFLQRVLNRAENPWLVSESILALGGSGQSKSIRALSNLLMGTKTADSVPVWKALRDRHRNLVILANRLDRQEAEYEKAFTEYENNYEKWQKTNPNAPGSEEKKVGRARKIVIGLELIYLARLRASAAIALGRIGNAAARSALRMALAEKYDEYSDLYKAEAIIALGQLGDVRSVPALLKFLDGKRVGKTSPDKESPLRGYAALAMGFYARHDPKKQDRPKSAEICRLLAARLADRGETPEVRAAAALALGLTGRTENLKLLQQATKTLTASDNEVMIGYVLLGRGMLGDSSILEPAGKLLTVANDRPDVAGILARRAAVLGLGVLGKQEGIPTLIVAWDLNYYVNREVALAFALCEAYNATDPLVKLLGESDKPLARAFAAQCLGELFAGARPGRISRLTLGSNYTVKNMRMIRFQAIANEFLFAYLIPAGFGEQWR
ncbi:MAG TPA: HEAT repeat domain-containing protein, partial [Phycisphaerae bacterium]|nr:HEAT repeat domain-containing protein [Phycisphaerae bacterium]